MEENVTQKGNSFIYLLILALGIAIALIFYLRSQSDIPTKDDMEIQQIETQSSSDEVEEIENDLDSTNLDDLDRELDDIEAELNQSN